MKKDRNNRLSKLHIIIETVCLVLVFVATLFACNKFLDDNAGKDTGQHLDIPINSVLVKEEERFVDSLKHVFNDTVVAINAPLVVNYISCGQGDCTLLTCEGQSLLIDAGPNEAGTLIQNYLNKLGITKLDYVVLTHYDYDHAGGMDVIIQKFDCRTVFLPDYTIDTKSYLNCWISMDAKGYRAVSPEPGTEFMLGSAKVSILAPSDYNSDDENNYSVCLRVQYGRTSFLFTGDAESEEENELMVSGFDIDADVLHVGHHGSYTSTSQEFLDEVTPTYAVISCGMDNPHGHPHRSTLNKLKEKNIKVFRTDEQGNIIATSNGTTISWNRSPSYTWNTGTVQE